MIGPHVSGCVGETCRCAPIVDANVEHIRALERQRIADYVFGLAKIAKAPELSELLLDLANRIRFGVLTREAR